MPYWCGCRQYKKVPRGHTWSTLERNTLKIYKVTHRMIRNHQWAHRLKYTREGWLTRHRCHVLGRGIQCNALWWEKYTLKRVTRVVHDLVYINAVYYLVCSSNNCVLVSFHISYLVISRLKYLNNQVELLWWSLDLPPWGSHLHLLSEMPWYNAIHFATHMFMFSTGLLVIAFLILLLLI